MTYSSNQSSLNAAIDDVAQLNKDITAAADKVRALWTRANNLATVYGPLVTLINADAGANPGDSAYQDQKAMKDKVAADFGSAKSRVEDIDDELVTLGELDART